MIPWLKSFFTDETAFAGIIRALLLGAGTAQMSGEFDQFIALPDWVGIMLVMMAGMVRSSSLSAKTGKKKEVTP